MAKQQAIEHGIMVSAPLVRAILAGRKTQTRRIFKRPKRLQVVEHLKYDPMDQMSWHQAADGTWIGMWPGASSAGVRALYDRFVREQYQTGGVRCPYGTPGMRLWVRETWRLGEDGLPFDNGAPLRRRPEGPKHSISRRPLRDRLDRHAARLRWLPDTAPVRPIARRPCPPSFGDSMTNPDPITAESGMKLIDATRRLASILWEDRREARRTLDAAQRDLDQNPTDRRLDVLLSTLERYKLVCRDYTAVADSVARQIESWHRLFGAPRG